MSGSELIPALDFESANVLFLAVFKVWATALIFRFIISFLYNR